MNPTLFNPTTGVIATPNANVTPEQQAQAKASGFTVSGVQPPTTVITPQSLTPTAPYNLPSTPTTPTTSNLSTANNSAFGGITTDAKYTPPVNQDKQALNTGLQGLLSKITGQSGQVDAINNDAGLIEKKNKALAVSNEMDQLDKSYRDQVQQLKQTFQGSPEGLQQALNSVQDKYENTRANIALTYKVAAQDYQGAQEIAQQKIQSLKDSNAQALQAYSLIANEINNDLTDSEKLQVQANINNKQKQADEINTAYSSVLKSAAQNGAPASVLSAIDTAARLPSATAASIYAAAGNYVTDKSQALDIQYKEAQIGKLKADAAAAVAQDARVNPDTLQGMINVYKTTGILPTFGNSAKSPLRAQFYAALGADSGLVTDANTNKAIRAGLTTSLKTQQNQLAANQTAIGTLDKQLELVQKYSDQVGRTNSPLINKYLIGLRTGVFGDPDAAALNNIVKTASYEFAKILSGSSASIAGVSVSSAADAESMLNSAMTKGQFASVLNLMKQESNFRLKSQQETINGLQKDINNIGSLAKNYETAPVILKNGQAFDVQAALKAGYTQAQIDAFIKAN